MEFVMFVNGNEDEWNAMDEAEMGAAMSAIGEWSTRWEAAGKLLPGGYELDTVRKAKTVRPGPDGPVVTDGPYLELKEVVGGFMTLSADDIDEAVAIAATWPSLAGSSSIEVRPVITN